VIVSKTLLGACTLLLLLPLLTDRAQAGSCPEEVRRAAAVRERIEQEWPLRRVGPVVKYIADFGRSLARRSGFERDVRWRFAVVRDLTFNAYSIGDGIIYLTEGAILNVANEAELAAVIAHEMGHQLSGHFCAGSGWGGDEKPWWEVLFSSDDSNPHPAPALKQGHFGTLRRGAEPDKEQEADRMAARILRSAGYDPVVRLKLARRIARARVAGNDRKYALPRPGNERLRRIQALLREDF